MFFFRLGCVFVSFALVFFCCWIGVGVVLFFSVSSVVASLVFVWSCLFCLLVLEFFFVVFFLFALFCALCLLEWSRCCSCFGILVCFVCVCVLFLCACFFLFLMKITVLLPILVFWVEC